MKHYIKIVFLLCLISCSSKEDQPEEYVPVPVKLDIPTLFKEKLIPPILPVNNPLTVEGIALGKKLFFDKILSKNNSLSCASCHDPQKAFSDFVPLSLGVNNFVGNRNAMPLFNLAWNFDERFNWSGDKFGLEGQAFGPVVSHREMGSKWVDVERKLQNHPEYPTLFFQVFGTNKIDSVLVTKVIAQFERTLISSNSKFDKYLLGEVQLTSNELNGFNVFMDETRGDCFHCHGSDNNPLWTDNKFHNNGLDTHFSDLGLGFVTGDPNDNGKFKSPSLRNLAFTAPYMHDGRFETLEQVIDHYSEGLKPSPTIDPLMKKINQGGVKLTLQDKADLKAFLLTLSDYDFIKNPDFKQ